jgi:hypothetical protein
VHKNCLETSPIGGIFLSTKIRNPENLAKKCFETTSIGGVYFLIWKVHKKCFETTRSGGVFYQGARQAQKNFSDKY